MNTFIPELPNTKVPYNCPYCGEVYYDKNDRIFNSLNDTHNNFKIIKCKKCDKKYGIYYDYKGKIVTFINPKQEYIYSENLELFILSIKKKYIDGIDNSLIDILL